MPITFEQHPGPPQDHLEHVCNYCGAEGNVGLHHTIEGKRFWYTLCDRYYYFHKRQPLVEAVLERQFATAIQ